jgi:hypothetical protein
MYGKSGPVIRRPLYFTHNLSDAKDRGEYRAVAGAITEALTRRARAGIVGAVAGSIDWPTGNVVSLVAPMALVEFEHVSCAARFAPVRFLCGNAAAAIGRDVSASLDRLCREQTEPGH